MKRKGFALILCMLLIVVLLTLGASSFGRTAVENLIATKYAGTTEAFWLAESGLEYARSQLNLNWYNRASTGEVEFGKGTYVFQLYDTDSEGSPLPFKQVRVVSVGTVGEISRQIETILESNAVLGYGVYGVNTLELRDGVTVHGDAFIVGDVEVQAGASVVKIDDSVSPADPNAYSADVYYTGATATINGTVEGNVIQTAETPEVPTVDWAAIESSADYVLPGATILSGTLADGTYYIQGDVQLNDVNIDHGSIISEGKLEINGAFTQNIPSNGIPALANQTVTMEIDGTATVNGMLYCGEGAVELKTGAIMIVHGSIVAANSGVELKSELGQLDVYYKEDYLPPSPSGGPPEIVYWKELQNPYPLD